MKANNFVWRILGIAGVAAVLVYFVANLAGYFLNPLTTTRAYTYRSDEAITVSGYLVREEEVLPDNSGLLFITREEGERVSDGGSVGVVYHSEESLQQAQELQQLRLQLEQLEYAQNVATGSQEVLKLDSNIADGIFALKNEMVLNNYSAAGDEASALETLVLKRDYTYSGSQDEISGQIEALTENIRSLSSSTRQGSTSIRVNRSGYYSTLVDGYEAVLTPDMLEEMMPSDFKKIQPDSTVSSNVGKMIYGNTWYYVTLMNEEDIQGFQVGQEVQLRFVSGLEKDVPMTVERISQAENGRRLMVLSSERYLSVTTLLRDQNAQIILNTYTGIRVPKTALRVMEYETENEAGETVTESLTGVYCRVGISARFKPVTVLYAGEDYYLVDPNPSAMGSLSETWQEIRTLRMGDEVIVTAKDLYDGKVLN